MKTKTTLKSSIFHMVIIFTTIFNSTSYPQSNSKENTEQIIKNIPCRGEVEYFKNNKINTCVLAKDFIIDGYWLPESSKLFFNSDGKLDRCIISKETKFFGQPLPPGTSVFFNYWGEKLSFWLPENTLIQGHLIGAQNDGPGTPLYENGKLKEIWLVNDELIDGIPCTTSGNIFIYGYQVARMGTERRVKFYDNGKLKQALLFRDVTIQGHSYKKGEFIFLDKDGKIDLRIDKTVN